MNLKNSLAMFAGAMILIKGLLAFSVGLIMIFEAESILQELAAILLMILGTLEAMLSVMLSDSLFLRKSGY